MLKCQDFLNSMDTSVVFRELDESVLLVGLEKIKLDE